MDRVDCTKQKERLEKSLALRDGAFPYDERNPPARKSTNLPSALRMLQKGDDMTKDHECRPSATTTAAPKRRGSIAPFQCFGLRRIQVTLTRTECSQGFYECTPEPGAPGDHATPSLKNCGEGLVYNPYHHGMRLWPASARVNRPRMREYYHNRPHSTTTVGHDRSFRNVTENVFLAVLDVPVSMVECGFGAHVAVDRISYMGSPSKVTAPVDDDG
ncbi:unnamed protein product [Danaus chrysippus]|uniref:(African queen) hypothetical protein n=1 Tax=Danaus chrysippus TaxID=151541 RepID=A0A8J2W7P4_9NEOP|nr:unnamed protein product [Danaus chrysippus]